MMSLLHTESLTTGGSRYPVTSQRLTPIYGWSFFLLNGLLCFSGENDPCPAGLLTIRLSGYRMEIFQCIVCLGPNRTPFKCWRSHQHCCNWLVVWNMNGLFSIVIIVYGMFFFPLTKSIIFQRCRWLNHQPDDHEPYNKHIITI